MSITNWNSVRYSDSYSYFLNAEVQNVNTAFVYIMDIFSNKASDILFRNEIFLLLLLQLLLS